MLAQNHSIRKIRIALLLFSIAAPIFASLTFYLVDSISSNVDVLSRITGLILLFSGGSFLYVSTVHVLPKVAEHGRLTNWKLILIISGIFTPFLLTIAHVIGYNLALMVYLALLFF
jgi:zinc transporter 9